MKKLNMNQIWTGPECLTCLSTIAYDLLQRSTDDPDIQLVGMKKTYELLKNFTLSSLPTEIANKIYRMIQNITRNTDPFKEIKKKSNKLAKKAIDRIRSYIETPENSNERFRRAIAAAITGNLIDFGTAGHSIEININFLEKIFYQINSEGFAIDHANQLFNSLRNAKEIIYIADNAGEVYFDLFLLSQIQSRGVKVVLVVKGGPISNDATMDDVSDPIFDKTVAKIITTGTNALGISITESSVEFLDYLRNADFIIAKGQSNFETLYYHQKELTIKSIYFIFCIKCSPIAKFIGQNIGKNIVKLIHL